MTQPPSPPPGDTLGRVTAIDRSTLAEEIYRRLRRAILAGDLAAGERVQPDRLASIIGVSRTPVREALQRLLAEGYLEQEARHAFRVAPVDYRSGRELFAIRAVLEGLAAREAAQHFTEELGEALQRTIDPIDLTPGAAWPDRAVGDFHRILYHGSQNRHLITLLDRVFEQTLRYRFLTRSDTPQRRQETYEAHVAILKALREGTAEEAERLTRAHVEVLGSRFNAPSQP
ncbi:MAG: GntR family transcriptional regulator [Dehalococcoidia bacterium]|nr:MAG: GntR family transcriptional regulator [Dehalococcoidia bacterium]